jgi:hypothetical protein
MEVLAGYGLRLQTSNGSSSTNSSNSSLGSAASGSREINIAVLGAKRVGKSGE